MSKLDDIINEAGNTIDLYSAFTSADKPEIKQQIKALMLELVGPHESLSEQQIKDGRIYVLGDPQADAVDRYRDELAKKVEAL